MERNEWGAGLIVIGVLVVIVGILVYFTGWKWISWFGNLPGDIRYERGNVKVYIPVVSALLLSVLLSLLWRWLR